MSELPKELWFQNSDKLSMTEKMLNTSLRLQMSQRDRDLTHADIIGMFQPEELEARDTEDGRKVIHERISKALIAEGGRLIAGDWKADATRYQRLKRLTKAFSEAERAAA